MMIVSLLAGLAIQDPAPRIDQQYEPSVTHPFGRPNPDAPPQLEEFAFFVGAFNCEDERTLPGGETVRFDAIWNGHYFMNGHAIQDQYWAPGFYTTNIRQFDEAEGVWKVGFFSEPGYSTGVWTGEREGGSIVLEREIRRPDGTALTSRLTFTDISENGFLWRGAVLSPGGEPQVNWTSRCTRRH